MLQQFEKKLGATVHAFFGFGILCFVLGFLVVISEFLWRLLIALLFLIVAFALLHMAYRLQLFRDNLHHFLGTIPFTDNGNGAKKTVRKKRSS